MTNKNDLIKETEEKEYESFTCPFCKQGDYDVFGLQYHLQNSCEDYGHYNGRNIRVKP